MNMVYVLHNIGVNDVCMMYRIYMTNLEWTLL